MARFSTTRELVDWLVAAPVGTSLSAEGMADILRPIVDSAPVPGVQPVAADPGWRVRLWTVPAETRLGRKEVCEAFDRPASWLYRHTSAKTIPCRKMDGELYFLAGELRAWAREREEVITAGPMDSTDSERSVRALPRAS